MAKKHNHDDEELGLQDYARRLQFSMHQLAMTSTDMEEAEFEAALYTLGVVQGMPEFDEAKRAWVRFQRKDARSAY